MDEQPQTLSHITIREQVSEVQNLEHRLAALAKLLDNEYTGNPGGCYNLNVTFGGMVRYTVRLEDDEAYPAIIAARRATLSRIQELRGWFDTHNIRWPGD